MKLNTLLLSLYNFNFNFFTHPATQSEIFRTETIKRTLNPVFGKTLRSEHLPRSLLKEGCIKVRVMDEERYANDVCLGEVSIALRKIGPLVREGEGNSNTTTTLVAIPPADEQNNNCIMKKEALKEKTDSADVCSFKNATSTDSSQLVPSIQVNGSEKVEEPSDEELMSTYTLFPIKEVSGLNEPSYGIVIECVHTLKHTQRR